MGFEFVLLKAVMEVFFFLSLSFLNRLSMLVSKENINKQMNGLSHTKATQ